MFKNYWKMNYVKLKEYARKNNLRSFMEETIVLTKNRKIDTDFVINRRCVIDQLLQRDNRDMAFWSAIIAVLGAIISLSVNLF